MELEPSIEIFVNEKEDGTEKVALVIHQASVVDYGEDELVPGCLLSPDLAYILASMIIAAADTINNRFTTD